MRPELHIIYLKKKHYFRCIGALSARMSVDRVHEVPPESREGCQSPLGLELEMVMTTAWCCAAHLGPLEEPCSNCWAIPAPL